MRVISRITNRSYITEDSFIILNPIQAALYLDNGLPLLDIYVGREKKLCFVFPKNEYSKELFDKWVKHELK